VNRDRVFAAFVLLALAVLLGVTTARAAHDDAFARSDFLAFYCAGRVSNAGADPYRTEPLAACERETQTALHAARADRFTTVDPAPLPQTTLLAFRVFATLPYPLAARLFAVLVLLAAAVSVLALARSVALPWWAIAAALALGDFGLNAIFGQLPPFGIAAVALTGWALVTKRPLLAGAIVPVALIQPNIGLAAVLSVLLWVPRARVPALAGAVAFLVLGWITGGPALTLEYARHVIPAQALAEATSENQLSLTWLLWFFGTPETLAVRIGAVQGVVVVAASVAIAGRLAATLDNPAAIVFAPAAATVVLGEYVHANQFAYAVPLALLLAATPGRPSRLAWLALLLFTLPFYREAGFVVLTGVALIAVAARFAARAERGYARACATAIVVWAVAVLGLASLPTRPTHAPSDVASYLATGADVSFASSRMGADGRRNHDFEASSVRELATKVPPWIGLVLLLVITARTARGSRERCR